VGAWLGVYTRGILMRAQLVVQKVLVLLYVNDDLGRGIEKWQIEVEGSVYRSWGFFLPQKRFEKRQDLNLKLTSLSS